MPRLDPLRGFLFGVHQELARLLKDENIQAVAGLDAWRSCIIVVRFDSEDMRKEQAALFEEMGISVNFRLSNPEDPESSICAYNAEGQKVGPVYRSDQTIQAVGRPEPKAQIYEVYSLLL